MLMQAAMAGDDDAYRALLAALADALRGAVRHGFLRAGRSPDEAEDVVQETLLAIHLKRHTWDSSKPVGPWVRAIARNKLIDALRRRGCRLEVPLDEMMELTLAAPEQDGRLARRDLDRLLGQLGARQQAIVRALSLEGRTVQATAARLAMSEGAVRVALHRALKRLAALYRRSA
jgi:RNA polymerase sigma-70 factor (ECF subfamily)